MLMRLCSKIPSTEKNIFVSSIVSVAVIYALVSLNLFVETNVLSAQNVGIGTQSPDPSARLHILASDKGVLLPSVGIASLTNPAPITSPPATGLLIFNDGSGGVDPRGFYWWNGTQWRYLMDSVSVQGLLVGDGTFTNPIGLQSGTNVGDVIMWNGTQWIISPAPFDSVCSSAVANYIQKWTGTELCNSIIYDNGTQIGIGTVNPHSSAVIDIQDTTRGILVPRMTTAQRDAISNPASGLLIYNTDKQCFEFWNGLYWQSLQNCYRPLLDSVLCPTINDSLVGWWTFNDSTATDLSGNGNNGTIFGSPIITCYTNYSQTNCYIEFDGVNDYVEIPNSPTIDITGSEITIVAWVMDTDPLGGVAVINKERQYEIEVRYITTDRLTAAFDTATNGQDWAWIHTGVEVPLNRWFMVAVVYDGRFIWYYLDGELVSVKENFSSAGPGNPVSGNIGSDPHPLRFAARDNSPPLDGIADSFRKINIDEVRIYNRALTPEEIKCLYLIGVTYN